MKLPKREVLGPIQTSNENLLKYDDMDGRKFMVGALGRLNDRQRLSLVNWGARLQKKEPNLRVQAPHSHRGTIYYPVNEALSDISMLTIMYGVCARVLLTELERRARRA